MKEGTSILKQFLLPCLNLNANANKVEEDVEKTLANSHGAEET